MYEVQLAAVGKCINACSGSLCGKSPSSMVVSRMRLVAAPDLFHTAIISPNRHRPAARAAETALVGVALVSAVTTLTPTRPAEVNANAAGAYVHTLSKGRCRSRGQPVRPRFRAR
jgi:hypothetical protein